MSPWRVLLSIDACKGLMPPVPRISVRFFRSASFKVCSSMKVRLLPVSAFRGRTQHQIIALWGQISIFSRFTVGTRKSRSDPAVAGLLAGPLLRSEGGERLVLQDVEARDHADDGDEERRHDHARDVLAREHPP